MISWLGLLSVELQRVVQETLRILRAMHTLPPRRSRIVTMAVPSTMEPINALALSCSTSSLRMTTSLLTTASRQRNGGAELPPPPRRYALSKPGHLPSIRHTMLSSTRASPGRKRLWRVTSGRISALSASDRHRRGWSTKSAFRRRCGCLRRRLTPNWCGGTEWSSGQRPESARGGRRGYRKRAAQ
jgi:hypothetical protein